MAFSGGNQQWWTEQKIYSGTKFEAVEQVETGDVCAVTGLTKTYPGEGLGVETAAIIPVLQPVLSYRVVLPSGSDAHIVYSKLRELEEEDPQLHIVWMERTREIHIQLMGEVQTEILKRLILERFGVDVEFGSGSILYKETILEPVVGVGHFEPLRHYAEVHILMEPLEAGSGIIFASNCSEDILGRNWQRLVLTHLEEKQHIGVLTGSPITDIKITLITGRAHIKHTEGGDFRQATYRAVRHGLKKAKSIVLEPYYNFRLEIPSDSVGRAMSDIQRMCGEFTSPELDGENSILSGSVPVVNMRGYQTEMTAYTRGRGRLFCTLKGYYPCHNQDEIIKAFGYDSEEDAYNPTGSVFCANGAGYSVPWVKVEEYMHLENVWIQDIPKKESMETAKPKYVKNYGYTTKEDQELEDIFVRTYGPIKQRNPVGFREEPAYLKGKITEVNFYQTDNVDNDKKVGDSNSNGNLTGNSTLKNGSGVNNKLSSYKFKDIKEYLLVDGYNIIFSWDELKNLAEQNMDSARTRLMDALCNYQGIKQCEIILVFDAYKVKGGLGTVDSYHNIHVVYTKEAETADQYIEKVTQRIAKEHRVTVATSDALEQLIILGQGAIRLSANDLKEEIRLAGEKMRIEYLDNVPSGRMFLKDRLPTDLLDNINKLNT